MPTHIGIPLKRIINLETEQLANDNTAHAFFFDRQFSSVFAMPKGCSFVITDIVVHPEVTKFSSTQFFLVVITIDGGRSLSVRCDGRSKHISLTSGLVIPDNNIPSPGTKGLTGRNTTFSTGPVNIQVMGYFINGERALGVGKVFEL